MQTPTQYEIKKVIDAGGSADDIDELFYPGERRRYQERKNKYPIPEGTGRQDPSSYDIEITGDFTHSDYKIKGIWIGSIHNHYVGSNGGPSGCYRTHDGKKFAHYGGPTGAETYLIERYWLYGNPPETLVNSVKTGAKGIIRKLGKYIVRK